jgi:hypothetical protein
VTDLIGLIPILTTTVAVMFAAVVFKRYRDRRSGPHLLWWAFGILVFGVGTFAESVVTVFGWNEFVFRGWYIAGALLGGAPLAQGTVYLLLERRTANRLTAVLLPFVIVASVCVVLTPIDQSLVEPHRLSGSVMEWTWVRLFSPFINLYAVVFLVGGAVLSAMRFRRKKATFDRFVGNVMIAIGAILPGVGGAATRMGYVEVLYVTEFVGLVLIFMGYRWNVRGREGVRRRADAEPAVGT